MGADGAKIDRVLGIYTRLMNGALINKAAEAARWSVFFSDSKEYDWSFADAVNDDIVNSKGDEQKRAIEKRMSDVIGWMSFRLFLGIVFGGMAAGVLELIWLHDKLATGLQWLISLCFSVNGVVGLAAMALIGGVWALLYTVLGVPIILIELIVCIVYNR